MGALAVLLLVLALVIGGVGLLLEGLKWLLILALAIVAAGAVVGWIGRSRIDT